MSSQPSVRERTADLRQEVDELRHANAALESRTAQQRAESGALRQEVDELRRANAALEARLERLEARASGGTAP